MLPILWRSNHKGGEVKKSACNAINTPLRAEVNDGRLVVEIGIETLEWASKASNGGPLADCKVDARRRREWATDVVKEMLYENEVGESPLIRFIDEMMRSAADHGSAALIWNQKFGRIIKEEK